MAKLILASSSQYRRKLLARLQLPFECKSPDIDESPLANERPKDMVKRLSEAKARALSSEFSNHLIIGSDQVAVLGGNSFLGENTDLDGKELRTEVLTKPGSYEAAFKQLKSESGKRVRFLTGLALLNSQTNNIEVDIVTTEVEFRQLTDQEISTYLHQDEPYDCAGSFKSEGLGITLFEGIYGKDPTALVGLPLIRLGEMLRSHN